MAENISLYVKGLIDYHKIVCTYIPRLSEENNIGRVYSSETEIENQNLFDFQLLPLSAGSEIGFIDLFTNDPDTDFSGSEVYAKRGSELHEFIIDPPSSLDLDLLYINIKKPYIYIGKLYPKDIITNEVTIETHNLKDFVTDAIPYHQRTPNFREFLGVSFDNFYSEIYGRMNNVLTLADPYETRSDYLRFLLGSYGMTSIVPESSASLIDRDRFYLTNLPSLLKKKCTYESIYSFWRTVINATNRLNVYELWHKELPLSASNIRVYCENNLNASEWGEWRYIDSYPSLSASDPYNLSASSYPTYSVSGSAGIKQSPHYKVQMDLSDGPLSTDAWIDENIYDVLIDKWEEIRPVSRFAEYESILSASGDFSGNDIDTYGSLYTTKILTRCYKIVETTPGSILGHIVNSGTSWTINHGLNTNVLVVQCYRDLGVTIERMVPSRVHQEDMNTLTLSFNQNESLYVLISSFPGAEGVRYSFISDDHSISASTYMFPDYLLYPVTDFWDVNNDQFVPLLFAQRFDSGIDNIGGIFQFANSQGDLVGIQADEYYELTSVPISDTVSRLQVLHTLDTQAVQVDVFRWYSETLHQKLIPEKIEIVDVSTINIFISNDDLLVNDFLVILKKVANTLLNPTTIMSMIKDNVRIGNGTSTSTYDPHHPISPPSGSTYGVMQNELVRDVDWELVSDTINIKVEGDLARVKFTLKALNNISVTEIGIWTQNYPGDPSDPLTDFLVFYTSCSPLFVVKGTLLTLFYTISFNEIR